MVDPTWRTVAAMTCAYRVKVTFYCLMVRLGRQGPIAGRSPLLVEQLTWRADTCGSFESPATIGDPDPRAQALGDGPPRTEIWAACSVRETIRVI
jgi:hypothetical protein